MHTDRTSIKWILSSQQSREILLSLEGRSAKHIMTIKLIGTKQWYQCLHGKLDNGQWKVVSILWINGDCWFNDRPPFHVNLSLDVWPANLHPYFQTKPHRIFFLQGHNHLYCDELCGFHDWIFLSLTTFVRFR